MPAGIASRDRRKWGANVIDGDKNEEDGKLVEGLLPWRGGDLSTLSFLLDRKLGLIPCFPAAYERENLGITFLGKFLHHTGARAFVRSGTVEDNRFVFWILRGPFVDGLRVFSQCPFDFR